MYQLADNKLKEAAASILKNLRIFYMASFAGDLIFFFICIYLYRWLPQMKVEQTEPESVYMIITAVIAAGGLILSLFAYRIARKRVSSTWKNDKTETLENEEAVIEDSLLKLRTIHLTALPLLNFFVMVGLVVLLQLAMKSQLPLNSYLWFNLLPLAGFILYLIRNFPTTDRVFSDLKDLLKEG